MYYVLGNWKSHGSAADVEAFYRAITPAIAATSPQTQWGLALPFPYLSLASSKRLGWIGAQNSSAYPAGAYTGEIHAAMLRDNHCDFCLVGHSERRKLFQESSEELRNKVGHLVDAQITTVFCIGESLAQREAGLLEQVLDEQLRVLDTVPAGSDVIVAYEPVWAIGTGRAAQPEDVNQAHTWIRQRLAATSFESAAILYGGSVKPSNAAELGTISEVGGFLIGGASLDATSFATIYHAFAQAKNPL